MPSENMTPEVMATKFLPPTINDIADTHTGARGISVTSESDVSKRTLTRPNQLLARVRPESWP